MNIGDIQKPFVNVEIFWDVYTSKLDYFIDKIFIAERVLTKGTEDDIVAFYRYYRDIDAKQLNKDESIKSIIKKIEYLDPITIEYVSELFDLKKEELACCIRKF